MKRLILMAASLAAVLVTGAVFAQADEFRPGINPNKEYRLEEGMRAQFQGHVSGVDMRDGGLLLQERSGALLHLKAPREKLARLRPGDPIRVAVQRGPGGVDHVVRMWRVREERGNVIYDEMY